MKNFFRTLFVIVSVISCLSGCQSVPGKGYFNVKDGKLLDANNQEFVIRGMNVPHAWFPEQSYNALEEISKYNTNCIRIVWETGLQVSDLDNIINRCIELKMIPMIELHDATGDSTDTKLLKMAEYFACNDMMSLINKYEKYVLVNIANEWGDHIMTDQYWYNSYKKAISIIRDAGYKATLVIDAPGWGQNITPVLNYGQYLVDYDPCHNLLFSVHMYGSWNDRGIIKSTLEEVHQKQLPLIIGEFGYDFNEGDNNLTCRVDHQQILKVCNDLVIGYLPWSWSGNNEENRWLDLVSRDDWKSLTRWGSEILESEVGIKATAEQATVFD